MKQILATLLLVSWLASPAMAKGKKTKHVRGTQGCPAAICTDHSYDMAYTAPNQPQEKVKDCPAATCTDHSYDEAYSARKWHNIPSEKTTAPARNPLMVDRYYGPPRIDAGPTAPAYPGTYTLSNYTFYGHSWTGVQRPSAYEGDDAPTYDGAALNAYRNMRYLNVSERLPSNNGK